MLLAADGWRQPGCCSTGGAEIDRVVKQGATALMYACLNDHAGADPFLKTPGGLTSLAAAAAEGHVNTVRALMRDRKRRRPAGHADSDDTLVVVHACLSGHVEVVRVVLMACQPYHFSSAHRGSSSIHARLGGMYAAGLHLARAKGHQACFHLLEVSDRVSAHGYPPPETRLAS